MSYLSFLIKNCIPVVCCVPIFFPPQTSTLPPPDMKKQSYSGKPRCSTAVYTGPLGYLLVEREVLRQSLIRRYSFLPCLRRPSISLIHACCHLAFLYFLPTLLIHYLKSTVDHRAWGDQSAKGCSTRSAYIHFRWLVSELIPGDRHVDRNPEVLEHDEVLQQVLLETLLRA